MIPLVGTSFDGATRKRYISDVIASAHYASSPRKDELRSFLRHTIELIMTRSF
jgi:hypothetical protein